MKINNIILVLRTRIILLSSFVIYFFRICHSGCFPIIHFIKNETQNTQMLNQHFVPVKKRIITLHFFFTLPTKSYTMANSMQKVFNRLVSIFPSFTEVQ